jgi:nucleoside-diphosphate-sugar epimerase
MSSTRPRSPAPFAAYASAPRAGSVLAVSEKPSAFVFGATGFLGRALVQTLASEGWRLTASGRRPAPPWLPDGVEYRRVDLAAGEIPREMLGGCTQLFHLAGASSSRSSEEEMNQVNVAGTRALMNAAVRAGVRRVVHVSSTAVYGEAERLPSPVTERVTLRPSRPYGVAKMRAEQQVWAAADQGIAVSVLRPVTVFGPGNSKLLASAILDAAVERRAGCRALAVSGAPLELRLVHVRDFVDACRHLATADLPSGQAYNLASGLYPISYQVAEMIAREMGMQVELTEHPEPGLDFEQRRLTHKQMLADGMAPEILLSPERLRFLRKANRNNRLSLEALEATGFRPVVTDIAAAVTEVIAWYREHLWIL